MEVPTILCVTAGNRKDMGANLRGRLLPSSAYKNGSDTADQQVYTAISRCRIYETENNNILVRQSDNIYIYFFLIKVGECDGRNNAIISELRRQNKNGKDAHCN